LELKSIQAFAEIALFGNPLRIDEWESNIWVYPNPTTGELRIENGEWRITGIEVFDVYGRKQKAESRTEKGNSPPFMEGWQPQADGVVINISHLQTGIYIIAIHTNQGTIHKKIVKE
jgi:hypothetical protein